jgi:soluble lytic murein transglycosylase
LTIRSITAIIGPMSRIVAPRCIFNVSLLLGLLFLTSCGEWQVTLFSLSSATATPTATLTSTLTSTVPPPTATFTPSPTPTLSPTPTPDPAVVLATGRRYQSYGDYYAAVSAYETALTMSSLTDEKRAEARFRMGQCAFLSGEYPRALAALEGFDRDYPQDAHRLPALFFLARSWEGLDDWEQAIAAYRAYLIEPTLIADQVYERIGDAYTQLQDPAAALVAYQAALTAASGPSQMLRLREKMAMAYQEQNAYDEALAQYETILEQAQSDTYRAQVLYKMGQVHRDAEDEEAAHSRFRQAMDSYPRAYAAYLSLVELVQAGVPVDEFQRGLVDYYAGAYGPAVEAFYRYIEDNPHHTGDAHYYAGLSLHASGSYELAIREFDRLIEGYPKNERVGQTWLEKARAYAAVGDYARAMGTYRRFADNYPQHGLAAEAIWRAARLAESLQEYDDAIAAYTDLTTRYPDSDHAAEVLFRAGLCHYRQNELDRALTLWQRLIEEYPVADHVLAARFWVGKTLLLQGFVESAQTELQAVVEAQPEGYYGVRARDLLLVETSAPGWPAAPGNLLLPPDGDPAGQTEAEDWLATWVNLPSDGQITATLSAAVLEDSRLQRGEELLAVGLRAEAMLEFDALRKDFEDNPLRQYQLALYFRDLGLYDPSIRCAMRLIKLSPESSLETAPRFIQQLAYPVYFSDLLFSEAAANRVDPLLTVVLTRQESLFDDGAESWAGAIGLMQIIPTTGEWIALKMPWPGYQPGDLYRPYLNVKFGVWYLAQALIDFEGNVFPALAGYNGGPRNAVLWMEATGDGDPDLFVEVIDRREPVLYVKEIYRQYDIYRRLYGG